MENNTKIKFREKVASRKFVLMLMIFLFSSFIVMLPAFMGFLGVNIAAMMTGGEYVSLVIGNFAIYSGANIAQKKMETSSPESEG